MPCVTSKSWPLNAADSSLPRKTHVIAMSRGVGKVLARGAPSTERSKLIRSKNWRAVVPAASPRIVSIAAKTVRMRSLAIGPGKTRLTRMPRGPSSRESSRDRAFKAALGTVYAVRP